MQILIVNNANHEVNYSECERYGEVRYLYWKDIPTINFSSVLADKPSIVITGGSQHVYDMDKTPELYVEIEFLRYAMEIGCPMIGICLGFQLLQYIFGNQIVKLDTPCIGHGYLDIESAEKIPTGLSIPLLHKAFSFHYDGVKENTHPELLVLARSKPLPGAKGGLVYCFRHKTKPVFGIQSHPDAMRKEIQSCCLKYHVETLIHEQSIYEDIFYHFFDYALRNYAKQN